MPFPVLLFAPAILLGGTMLAPASRLCAGAAVNAAPSASLSFERVFASPSLNGPAPRGVKLSPDGRYLTLLRNRANDRERYDLWGYDRQKGEWRMLVDSEKLSSGRALSEAEKMQRERQRIGDLKGIVTYSWSADGKSVLVPLDGDLLLAGLDGSVRKVEGRGRRAQPAAQPQGRLCFLCARPSFLGGAGAGRRGAQPDPGGASRPSIGARRSSSLRKKWRA
jgi:dipeptidyl-peptidase-4